jgi:prepilin-type N-terminal cleavage/methylation domain-containing protein
MLLVGGFGIGKLTDLNAFREALGQWTTVPTVFAPFLTVTVPALEVLIAGSWFVSGRAHRWALAGAGLISAFTLAYLFELLIGPGKPSCGCMGRVPDSHWSEQPWVVLGRNSLLIAIFILAARRPAGRRNIAPIGLNTAMPRRAFTLIETLCVIVLVGLLALLIMPTLGIVRQFGRQAVSISNLRGHAAVMSAYTNDYREAWPYYTYPDATLTILRSERNNIARAVVYFGLYNRWHLAMLDAYYEGRARAPELNQPYVPGAVAAGAYGWNTYQYPCVFLTSHEFWNARTRESPARPQLRTTRAGDVTWPAAKTILVGFYSSDAQDSPGSNVTSGRREFAFVDGHAKRVPREGYSLGYVNAEGVGTPLSRHAGFGVAPGLHTMDGVRGRDVIGD